MGQKLSFRSLSGAKEGYMRLRTKVQNLREKSKEQVMSIARTGEVALSAGVMGVTNGYFNDPSIGPVPVDLGLGAGLKLVSIVMGGETAQHIGALGDGAIGAFVYRKAARMGLEASAEANDVEPGVVLARRELGQNDDGTARGAEGEHPGGG